MSLDRAVAALGLGLAAALGAAMFAGAAGRQDEPIAIEMRWSNYDRDSIVVPVGRPVTFILRNADPIDHEWIVGDASLHQRHRSGTEPVHDQRPTEVTVPALTERRTTITFDRPGTYTFICHLPGHEAYGMTGTLVVAGG